MDIREEIKKLSDAEKILLVEEIWDDIARDKTIGLTEQQKNEIERRLKLIDEGKVKSYSLEETREKIKSFKKNV